MVSSNEDDEQFVNCIGKSPSHGLLYINKIVWNGNGDPIKLFGYNFQEFPPNDYYLQVFPHTPNWTSLCSLLAEYRHLYKDNFVNEHVFGELIDHLSMSAH